jgi:hypothetical protein
MDEQTMVLRDLEQSIIQAREGEDFLRLNYLQEALERVEFSDPYDYE